MTLKEAIKPTTKKVILSILLAVAISFHLIYINRFMLYIYGQTIWSGWWEFINKGILGTIYYPLLVYANILPMEVSGDTMYPNILTYVLFILGAWIYAYVLICILSLIIGKFRRKQP